MMVEDRHLGNLKGLPARVIIVMIPIPPGQESDALLCFDLLGFYFDSAPSLSFAFVPKLLPHICIKFLPSSRQMTPITQSNLPDSLSFIFLVRSGQIRRETSSL